MYTAFFNLKMKPFELVPNPEFLYQSRSHKKALSYLRYGLMERAGFILLTGEVGAGKTTIIRDIINNLDEDVALSMLFNTRVTSKQVVAMINEDFGLDVSGKDKVALLRDLNDHLLELHSRKMRPVVIIDEAQNLNSAALEEIRLLSNLEASNAKLLQIIMVGQPELKETIAKDELRQLRQRISVHCHLSPLSREEIEDYVYHRLETAGNRNALVWSKETFDALYKYSQGIPRLINVFCDFILLSAFAEESHELTIDLVEEVIGDISWDNEKDDHAAQKGNQPMTASVIEKLALYEQRISMLEDVAEIKNEIFERLSSHEQLIKKIHIRREKNFLKIESVLACANEQLERITSGAGNGPSESIRLESAKTIKIDDRKSLLGRLFS